MRVRFLIFTIERANHINRRFIWVGEKLGRFYPNTQRDLDRAGIEISAERYLTASFFSAMVYGLLAFSLMAILFMVRDGIISPHTQANAAVAGAAGLIGAVFFLFLHAIYPRIIAANQATGIDQSLIFALKNMLIQVKSGVSLFSAMVNVSKSGYGYTSAEFGHVVQDINAGESEPKALEKLALRTKSEYLKKTSWQLLTSIRSGASVAGALQSVVDTLQNHQLRSIRDYAGEMNMLILMYLMLAAAIPTLGITFLVILSSMGGSSIGPEAILATIMFAFVMQVILFGFMKNRMPKVYL